MQTRQLALTGLAFSYAILVAIPASARDLVYQPVSPSFGGSPLNGSYILGLAGANNFQFTENPRSRAERRAQDMANGANDPVQQFSRQITSSLLSQIATTIGQQIIGENARDRGTFNLNGTVVNFNRVGGQINIDIAEPTGGRTNIQIPVPQY